MNTPSKAREVAGHGDGERCRRSSSLKSWRGPTIRELRCGWAFSRRCSRRLQERILCFTALQQKRHSQASDTRSLEVSMGRYNAIDAVTDLLVEKITIARLRCEGRVQTPNPKRSNQPRTRSTWKLGSGF